MRLDQVQYLSGSSGCYRRHPFLRLSRRVLVRDAASPGVEHPRPASASATFPRCALSTQTVQVVTIHPPPPRKSNCIVISGLVYGREAIIGHRGMFFARKQWYIARIPTAFEEVRDARLRD